MSMKRSAGTRATTLGSDSSGVKVDRQVLFDELRKRAEGGEVFSAVDVALAIGAAEPQVARTLIGLGAEGAIEKVDVGKYRANPIADLDLPDFLKAFSRASKMDATRMRDISEIERLKKNNDVMRTRLLRAQAERDHYLAALQRHGIDPGPLAAEEPPPAPGTGVRGSDPSGQA